MVIASGPYSEISQRPEIIDLIAEYAKASEAEEPENEKAAADDKEFEGKVDREKSREGFVPIRYYLQYIKAAWGNYFSLLVIFVVDVIVLLMFLAVPWSLI